MYEHSNKNIILGVDIGGSHITSALVTVPGYEVIADTVTRKRVDHNGSSSLIMEQWFGAIHESLAGANGHTLVGMGIAVPGPFDYDKGICLMEGVNKYNALYNLNVEEMLRSKLPLNNDIPVNFENDASCFGLGESLSPELKAHKKIIAVTLGTGFGATFLENNIILKEGEHVPTLGQLYDQPYLDGIAEDRVSTAWILSQYNAGRPEKIAEVKNIAELALGGDQHAINVFNEFGVHFCACIMPWIRTFAPSCLVIGGSIAKSAQLFLSPLERAISEHNINIDIKVSTTTEVSAIKGAAFIVPLEQDSSVGSEQHEWRKTSQALLPDDTRAIQHKAGEYDIYPFHHIGSHKIYSGYDLLAEWICDQKEVVIDGYGGNDWDYIQAELSAQFDKKGLKANWISTTGMLKAENEITGLVTPFLGEANAVWGTRTTLALEDFYTDEIKELIADSQFDLNIIIGTGAALSKWKHIIYVDIPKNEIQYRMRAGSITNLGSKQTESPAMMYKRFYFVDWIVYNRHRQQIASNISIIADGQWKTAITWAFSRSVREGLENLSRDVIRARPWFEAGTWGGDWMKQFIPQINQHEINYAWSFELIAPENGIVLESDQHLLELSFDWLMELQTQAILGRDAERFGTEFPIRFDFLDTFDGGNLSIQCHPSLEYIRENFGENITQDETYYILDCKDDAQVYLGFQEDIVPADFKAALEESVVKNTALDIDKYVQSFPSHKHDLFLIPHGTIHSSGVNNMVLEISATPYIFTFKMYDWVRLDLDGNPRPINIEHAFNNLDFTRKGEKVPVELISAQTLIHHSPAADIIDLATHKDHFYKVQRLEITSEITVPTNNQVHVLMLVEGESVIVQTKSGSPRKFNYAETFIIPAAAESYRVVNESGGKVKLVTAFIKEN